MNTLVIDVHEQRKAATYNIAGTYLHVNMDDFTIMKLEVEMVDMIVKMNSEKCSKYVRYERGKKVSYLRLLKALYGCIKYLLLWYNLFSGTLEKKYFKLNPYDLYVANKTINSNKCTSRWYVNDLKISHVDSKLVEDIIRMVELRYGKIKIARGSKYVYIGMDVNFVGGEKVTFKKSNFLLLYLTMGLSSSGEYGKQSQPTHHILKQMLY